MTIPSSDNLTTEERTARLAEEKARRAQEDALNDVRAEQQMIEGALDTDASVGRLEQHRGTGAAGAQPGKGLPD